MYAASELDKKPGCHKKVAVALDVLVVFGLSALDQREADSMFS